MTQNETTKTNNAPDNDNDYLQVFADELQDVLYNYIDKIAESNLKESVKDFLKIQADVLMNQIDQLMNNGNLTEFALKMFENKVNNFRNRVNEKIKAASTKQDSAPAKRWGIKRITGWIFNKTSHFILTVIVTIFATVIAAIVVDIFADFGWLQSIKAFIYSILWSK